jgi:hypothetical protein
MEISTTASYETPVSIRERWFSTPSRPSKASARERLSCYVAGPIRTHLAGVTPYPPPSGLNR